MSHECGPFGGSEEVCPSLCSFWCSSFHVLRSGPAVLLQTHMDCWVIVCCDVQYISIQVCQTSSKVYVFLKPKITRSPRFHEQRSCSLRPLCYLGQGLECCLVYSWKVLQWMLLTLIISNSNIDAWQTALCWCESWAIRETAGSSQTVMTLHLTALTDMSLFWTMDHVSHPSFTISSTIFITQKSSSSVTNDIKCYQIKECLILF